MLFVADVLIMILAVWILGEFLTTVLLLAIPAVSIYVWFKGWNEAPRWAKWFLGVITAATTAIYLISTPVENLTVAGAFDQLLIVVLSLALFLLSYMTRGREGDRIGPLLGSLAWFLAMGADPSEIDK